MLDQLKNSSPLLKSKWKEYEKFFTRIEVPAKTILLKEGDISKKTYYIEKGCLRVCFNNKGKDITFQFFFENESVSSAESFRKSIPSLFTIETIEPCVLYWIHKRDMDEMMKELMKNSESRGSIVDALFERQINYAMHFLSFIRDTPKERYFNLVKEKPHIILRVPQHYIASYLGITPVSLSRIRNQVKSQ